MRLKKVIILGFKSFADRTVIEFHSGVTAIVGPNGCGKSNIADAFRWVMGEQSAKSMRGNRMPDVIFAGTSQRKPLNIAEVTLVFDDVEGQLPIEYEEVAITRRLHRSGESDYFINNHPVRLKDIHDLLLDSGIGRDAFAIFEQGKIDQIINYGPIERRYIFEEAAGILRFLQRKREALRKLEQADANTLRVRDIHQEVEKQIIILEEQSEKARLYKETQAALDTVQRTIYAARWEASKKKGKEIRQKELDKQTEIQQYNQHLNGLQLAQEEIKSALETQEKELKNQNEQLFKTRSAKEIKAKERLNIKERHKEATAREKECIEEIKGIKKQTAEHETELAKGKQKHAELEGQRAEFNTIIHDLREKQKNLDDQVTNLRAQQQQVYQQRLKHNQVENLFDSDLKQNKIRLENTQERISNHRTRCDRLAQQMEEFSHQLLEKKEKMQESAETIEKQQATFVVIEEEHRVLSNQIENTQAELQKTISDLSEHRARQKVLLRLKEEMEGFSTASKRLMQESANPKSPLHNKIKGLYEYLQPKAHADPQIVEKALMASMRPYAQTLVVETLQDFHECLSFSSKNGLKDFSLVCMEQLHPVKSRENKKDATLLLPQMNDHQLASHFLDSIVIADTLSDAFEQMGRSTQECEWWNKDGSFIDRRRVVFYATENENNLFTRTAELNRLEKKIKERENNHQLVEAAIKTLQSKCVMLQAQRSDIDKTIRREEMKLAELNFSIQRISKDFEKGETECTQIEQEIQNLLEVVNRLSSTIVELEAKRLQARDKGVELQQQLGHLEENLKQHTDKLKVEQHALQQQQASYQRIVDESHKVLNAVNLCQLKEQEAQQRAVRLEQEILKSREFQERLSQQSNDCDQTLEEVEKTLLESSTGCQQLEKTILQYKQQIKQLDSDIKNDSEKVKKGESEANALSIQTAQQESAQQSIEKDVQERYQLTIDDLYKTVESTGKSIDELEKTARTLRQEIDAAGNINMTSIEEYDKHKVRYAFLNEQINDMVSSKEELIKIIADLDTESRKIFKETFDKIRANFKKNFGILFDGGEADLHFTETQDVLDAGIEIIARPPGKQMRSIHLLSGGEKCLTALALLFAIFEVKPAPFCILDEIDAPLDDSNVERFANIVKQFIDKCQFVIITHNKRTMAIADILFGVSMQERGVSKILSIDIPIDNCYVCP